MRQKRAVAVRWSLVLVLVLGVVSWGWADAGSGLRPMTPTDHGRPLAVAPGIREGTVHWNDFRLDPHRILGPDLVITDMTTSPEPYNPPCDLEVTVTVQNIGTTPAGHFGVCCFLPIMSMTPVRQHVAGLRPGESVALHYTLPVRTAVLWVMARANDWNELAELDVTNNERQVVPTPGRAVRDFSVPDIHLQTNEHGAGVGSGYCPPVANEPVELSYTVAYTSPEPGTVVDMNIYADDALLATHNLLVNSGSSTTDHLALPLLPAGSHTIRVAPAVSPGAQDTSNDQATLTTAWVQRVHEPYLAQYYAIDDYASVGGSPDLMYCVDEARWFGNAMLHRRQPFQWTYGAENSRVDWTDWGGGGYARVNNFANFVYYAGHGNGNGPCYCDHAFDTAGNLQMHPDLERWGRDAAGNPTLRWTTWMACKTLYDGVTTGGAGHMGPGPDSLSRWFQCFEGLHSIQGMRSLGIVGYWYDWGYCYHSSRRGGIYAYLLNNGYTLSEAWAQANRPIFEGFDRGFESAQLSAWTGNIDYGYETLNAPFPDYAGTPRAFTFRAFRQGEPSW